MKFLTDLLGNDKLQKFILFGALILALVMWFQSCNSKKQLALESDKQHAIDLQNEKASTDSLHFTKNKVGELEASKASYISKMEDLQKTNASLYEQIKKEKGKVVSVIDGKVTVVTKDVIMSNTLKKYPDGKTFGLLFNKDFDKKDGYTFSIKGESKFMKVNDTIFPGATDILESKSNLELFMGFKEDDKQYNVFARSKNKNVIIDSLSGVLIIPKPDKTDPLQVTPPKPKRFGVGFQVGCGFGLVKSQVFLTLPYIGVGISYNIIRF